MLHLYGLHITRHKRVVRKRRCMHHVQMRTTNLYDDDEDDVDDEVHDDDADGDD